MIEENSLAEVGKFHKTHALKGELNAILDIDPEYFEEGNPFIIEVDGVFVPFYAESVRSKGATSYLVKIAGIDTHEEARELVNHIIWVEKESLRDFLGIEEGEDLFLDNDLEGFRVVDERYGELGVLERVDDSTENVLFIVRDAAGEELMIPAADDFIVEVDEEKREIITTLPEELISLNSSED